MPYIGLRDPSEGNKTPQWFSVPGGQVNTIHGMLMTQGCWMLMRNFIWNWPNEWDYAEILADCLVKKRQTGVYNEDAKKYMRAVLSVNYQTDLEKNWVNNNYLKFVSLFGGIKFDDRNNDMKYYPKSTDLSGNNCFKERASRPIWDASCKFKSGSFPKHSIADLYLFKRTDRFTLEIGDQETFK
jgi:hypothetical protein